jgi:hypothetical protein
MQDWCLATAGILACVSAVASSRRARIVYVENVGSTAIGRMTYRPGYTLKTTI